MFIEEDSYKLISNIGEDSITISNGKEYLYTNVLLTPTTLKKIIPQFRPMYKDKTTDIILEYINNTYNRSKDNSTLCLAWLIGCVIDSGISVKEKQIKVADVDKYLLQYYKLVLKISKI